MLDGTLNPEVRALALSFLHQDIVSKGLQVGLLKEAGAFRPYTIPVSRILFNGEPAPFNYRYVLPAHLNNDGIIDFLLVGSYFDAPKTPDSPFGQRFSVTMLLSESS